MNTFAEFSKSAAVGLDIDLLQLAFEDRLVGWLSLTVWSHNLVASTRLHRS